jgi:hypothetical protein
MKLTTEILVRQSYGLPIREIYEGIRNEALIPEDCAPKEDPWAGRVWTPFNTISVAWIMVEMRGDGFTLTIDTENKAVSLTGIQSGSYHDYLLSVLFSKFPNLEFEAFSRQETPRVVHKNKLLYGNHEKWEEGKRKPLQINDLR